jgi:hypothetical protein
MRGHALLPDVVIPWCSSSNEIPSAGRRRIVTVRTRCQSIDTASSKANLMSTIQAKDYIV